MFAFFFFSVFLGCEIFFSIYFFLFLFLAGVCLLVMGLTESQIDEAMEVAVHASYCGSTVFCSAVDNLKSGFIGHCVAPDLVQRIQHDVNADILQFLMAGTPSYAVISKVASSRSNIELTSNPTWIVNPVGGFSSSLNGVRHFCLTIALFVDKEVILSIVSAPGIGEMYSAVKGRGAFCNGQRIYVSSSPSLQEALVVFPEQAERKESFLECLLQIQQELSCICSTSIIGSHGTTALDMCLVAAGKADVVFAAGIGLWDFAAAALILTEAGGVVHHVEDVNVFDWNQTALCAGNQEAVTADVVTLLKKHQFLETFQSV